MYLANKLLVHNSIMLGSKGLFEEGEQYSDDDARL